MHCYNAYFTLLGDEAKKLAGRLTGDVTLMLLNLCCTGVKLAGALDLADKRSAGAGDPSSLMSDIHLSIRNQSSKFDQI
jgi:hypothetical protein